MINQLTSTVPTFSKRYKQANFTILASQQKLLLF